MAKKKCTVYDTAQQKVLHRGRPWPTADGSPPKGLAANLAVLEEIKGESPVYDPLTHVIEESWEYDLNAGTATLVRTAVPFSLDVVKASKCSDIDTRTRQLIAGGFTHAGHKFSLSERAQLNLGTLESRLARGWVTFPRAVSTDDASVEYELSDDTECLEFLQLAMDTVDFHVASGRALKKLVMAAVTVDAVVAVTDDR